MPLPPIVAIVAVAQAAPGSSASPPAPATSAAPPAPAPPPPPAAPPPPPTSPTPPIDPETGQPTLPRDSLTGEPIQPRDATGQPLVILDDTGQPVVLRDETGQIVLPKNQGPRGGSVLDPDASSSAGTIDERGFRAAGVGGIDWHAHLELITGYNSNVIQTQDSPPNGPTTAHGSFFDGIDAGVDFLNWTNLTDHQDLRLGVRGQFYTPFNGDIKTKKLLDGTAIGTWNRTFTVAPRTMFSLGAGATLTSSNSALINDGPLFQLDPSNFQRVYTLDDARFMVVHELRPLWRVVAGIDAIVEATVSSAPVVTPAGQQEELRGLDYFTPILNLGLMHEFDPYNDGLISSLTQEALLPHTVNYTTLPPTEVGASNTLSEQLEVGWGHAFNEWVRSIVRAGASVAQAPPLDTNRSVLLSPIGRLTLTYGHPYWLMQFDANYSYGSANPRLGFGPSASGSVILQGIPYPHEAWNAVSLLALGSASHSEFLQGTGASTQLNAVTANLELRLALNTWLGLVAGYTLHYSTFDGAGGFPPLLRNTGFVGVSGYFSDDHSLPTLQTFTSPVQAF